MLPLKKCAHPYIPFLVTFPTSFSFLLWAVHLLQVSSSPPRLANVFLDCSSMEGRTAAGLSGLFPSTFPAFFLSCCEPRFCSHGFVVAEKPLKDSSPN